MKGLSLELHKGEFLTLLGGNGTGKTTTLKLLASLQKPYRGELTISGSVGMLPQNPQALFVKSTVRADLLEILPKSERKTERHSFRFCRSILQSAHCVFSSFCSIWKRNLKNNPPLM